MISSKDAAMQIYSNLKKSEKPIEAMTEDYLKTVIRVQVGVYTLIDPNCTIDEQKIYEFLVKLLGITVEPGAILDDKHNHIPWLNEMKDKINWNMWLKYKQYLSKSLSDQVIESLDISTDNILEQLENPSRQPRWDRRGLVVGDIQSGKTSNFVGLMCKAADAGYKAFIILSGQTDDLRSQTQKRIDKGFLGWDTNKTLKIDENSKKIGVGLIGDTPSTIVHALTSSSLSGDFKSSVFKTVSVRFGEAPLLFVLKKNKTVLTNLIKELKGYEDSDLDSVPLLLIDDEADYASVNTKTKDIIDKELDEETDPSTINKLIRNILDRFGKSGRRVM